MDSHEPSDSPSDHSFQTSPQNHESHALTRRFGRASIWVVFGVALLVRIVYFLAVEQTPVQFDARRYVAAAIAVPLAVTNPSLLTDSLARSQIDFQYLYMDRVRDEEVVWLTSHPPTFDGALDDVFFGGPVYALFAGTVIALSPRYDFWVIRLLQAMLDSLIAVFLWLLMRRLASSTAAWWAAGLWAFYGPAIYKTGEIVATTLPILILVTTVWLLIRAYDRPGRGALLGAGAMAAILVMAKSAALGLIVPLLIGWLWAQRRNLREALPRSLWIVVSYTLTMAPWLLIVWLRYGTIGSRSPEYAGGNFRSSNILYGEGYDLDAVPSDFWTYPVWREMKNQPMAYGQMYLRKFYRVWSRPYDDFRRLFPFGGDGVLWAHRIVVLLALFGILVWTARAGPVAFIPLSVIAYFVLLHMAFHALARYNLMAMPFVTAAATVGAGWLFGTVRGLPWRRCLMAGGVAIGVITAIRILRPAFWLSLGQIFGWQSATVAFWIAGVIAIVAGVWYIARLARNKATLRVGLGVSAVLVLVFLTQVVPREGHADWSVRLDAPEHTAMRNVTLPSWLVADSVYRAFAIVDAVVDETKNCRVTLTVDGIGSTRAADTLVPERFFYPKWSYESFLELYKVRRCDVRQWMITELDSAQVASVLADHRAEIHLSAVPSLPNPGGLTLYGDLPVDDYREWVGPRFEISSIERYYEGGDPRLWGHESLDFVTATSEFSVDGHVHRDDLSDRWGRQVGQYRMFITVITPGGRYLDF